MKSRAHLIAELGAIPARIREIEALGYDGAFSAEISSDPFFPLLLAAEHSERVGLTTAIAVAFARSPMTLAAQAHDLAQYSGGRFQLGLGSQIRPHITRRFGMPWSRPAARMREYVLALKTIWACWHEGRPLDFRGEFYEHTLMTPMFVPKGLDHPPPPVHVAGVGPRMTEAAAEVADGFIAHGFTTERYLREVTLPALEAGLARAGRSRAELEVSAPIVVITGLDEAAFAASRAAVTMQLAFYGSTPAYRPVLELHGWGDLQTELHRLSKEGRWDVMGGLLDDAFLDAFCLVCEDPADVAPRLAERYGDLVDVWNCTVDLPDPDAQRELLERVRAT